MKIILEDNDATYTVEFNHIDVTSGEMLEAFTGLMSTCGFHAKRIHRDDEYFTGDELDEALREQEKRLVGDPDLDVSHLKDEN